MRRLLLAQHERQLIGECDTRTAALITRHGSPARRHEHETSERRPPPFDHDLDAVSWQSEAVADEVLLAFEQPAVAFDAAAGG